MLTVEQKQYVKALVKYKKKKLHENFDDDDKYWFAHCDHKVSPLEINNYIRKLRGEKEVFEK